MKQYQYKTVSVSRSKVKEALKEFGLEGWELCATILEGNGENVTIHLFLKKEI